MRACLLACFCLQMAFNNLREIQLLLTLTACWLTYDTSQRFAILQAANQAAWARVALRLFEPGPCVCVQCGLGTVIAFVGSEYKYTSLCASVNVCLWTRSAKAQVLIYMYLNNEKSFYVA